MNGLHSLSPERWTLCMLQRLEVWLQYAYSGGNVTSDQLATICTAVRLGEPPPKFSEQLLLRGQAGSYLLLSSGHRESPQILYDDVHIRPCLCLTPHGAARSCRRAGLHVHMVVRVRLTLTLTLISSLPVHGDWPCRRAGFYGVFQRRRHGGDHIYWPADLARMYFGIMPTGHCVGLSDV
jgi:hypothetical protein